MITRRELRGASDYGGNSWRPVLPALLSLRGRGVGQRRLKPQRSLNEERVMSGRWQTRDSGRAAMVLLRRKRRLAVALVAIGVQNR